MRDTTGEEWDGPDELMAVWDFEVDAVKADVPRTFCVELRELCDPTSEVRYLLPPGVARALALQLMSAADEAEHLILLADVEKRLDAEG